MTSEIVIREAGNNPAPDDSIVARVDMSETGLFQRLGRAFRPGKIRTHTSNGLPDGEELPPPGPMKLPTPTPNAPPELAEAESQLAFLVSELNAARAALEKFPRSSSTPMQDQAVRRKQYRAALAARQSLCREPSTDLPLLLEVLHRPRPGQSSGMVEDGFAKVNALKAEPAKQAREAEIAAQRPKALARLAKAAIELSAAYEAALPCFPFPTGPTVRGVPTDLFRQFHNRLKNVRKPDDLL